MMKLTFHVNGSFCPLSINIMASIFFLIFRYDVIAMWAEQEPQQLMILDGGSIFSDLLSLVAQLKKQIN